MILSKQIKDLLRSKNDINSEVKLSGWVRSRRNSKAGFSFVQLHDGSCFDGIQIIADKTLADYDDIISQLATGACISVTGTLVSSEGAEQNVEIQASNITLLGNVEDPEHYPISKKRHTFEYLRTVAHLRPRTNSFGAISRLRHSCAQSIHKYLDQRGFFWVNTPIITGSDCEGAGELFRVSTLDMLNPPRTDKGIDFSQDFFGTETFLTVSGQLNVESHCMALSRVYTFGPTFRAENSNTSRHLAEFWMVEPEIAFADLQQNAAIAEDFLKTIIADILANCSDDLAFFAQRIDKTIMQRLEKVSQSEFVHMSYDEAVRILNQSGKNFEYAVKWGVDLQSEHERYLCEEHVQGPIIVTDYPQSIKAFYMRANDDGKTCAAMDILVPGIGELIGGSQREERPEQLHQKMVEHGFDTELQWYQDLRRYGTAPHAGFGLGFERFLSYLTGMENIRDVIPFPRTPKNASF